MVGSVIFGYAGFVLDDRTTLSKFFGSSAALVMERRVVIMVRDLLFAGEETDGSTFATEHVSLDADSDLGWKLEQS